MKRLFISLVACAFLCLVGVGCQSASKARKELRAQASATMLRAATFYHDKVAAHGGYVCYYTPDLKERWGEGRATADQIWVQPPGTPTVGLAYLKAYEATGDKFYLTAATEAAEALAWGQLQSGGWTNRVEFNVDRLLQMALNNTDEGGGVSSLDDGQTQSAIRFLVEADRALAFQNPKVHKAAQSALDALLAAQFSNGAFPQGFRGPVQPQPVLKASYPTYDWRTEGRVPEYWQIYTLNDNVTAYVADTLMAAYRVYKDEKHLNALRRLGDFLILAQMPDPQPAWAQQYGFDMKPVWARRFEPPAITGFESQGVLETLMKIYRVTGDRKYLEPIPRALAYLKASTLPDGQLARYYELQTNTPLFMTAERRDNYTLTYDDADLPDHYGWKFPSRLADIERQYNELIGNTVLPVAKPSLKDLEANVRRIIQTLDEQGRWISASTGERIVGQPNWQWQIGFLHISSEVFSKNIETLSEYLIATRDN